MLRLITLFVAVISTEAVAAPQTIQVGNYIRTGDDGTLSVRAGDKNVKLFQIDTIGSNGHICTMSGTIRGSKVSVDNPYETSEMNCNISVSAQGDKIIIAPITEEACTGYCGARANVYGTYRIPPAMCTTAGKEALKAQFLKEYRSKRYSQGINLLTTMLQQCDGFIHWFDQDRFRNDIALSLYHEGKYDQCLESLSHTVAGEVNNKDELSLPPLEFDSYISTANAIWFNKRLCTKAINKKK